MRHPYRIFLILVAVLVVRPLCAQEMPEWPAAAEIVEGSPEWLVNRFFHEKEFPDLKRYCTPEMAKRLGKLPHLGSHYSAPGFKYTPRLYYRDTNMVAVAVAYTHTDPKQKADFYAFVRRDDGVWKLDSVLQNTLSMSARRAMGVLSQTNIKPGTRDGWELQALSSFLLNDEQMKARFKEKRADMEKLTQSLVRNNYTAVIHGARRTGRVPADLWKQVHDLQFYYVELDQRGRVELNIVRAGESALGYFWVPPGSTPPAPTTTGYILMDPLGDGWFLYRRM